MYKPSDITRWRPVRPQPLEPIIRNRPWVVPVALAVLIVVLLIGLATLAEQAPGADTPLPPTERSSSL